MKIPRHQNPILIPKESILEGFIKTRKSLRIEGDFYGTLLSTEKVIIDTTSRVEGNIVCSDLLIKGSFEGNLFCAGQTSTSGDSQIRGQLFTRLFQNESDCDLDCFIQIPNKTVTDAVQEILDDIDISTRLSVDKKLNQIIRVFVENVYTATEDPKKIKMEISKSKEWKQKKSLLKIATF